MRAGSDSVTRTTQNETCSVAAAMRSPLLSSRILLTSSYFQNKAHTYPTDKCPGRPAPATWLQLTFPPRLSEAAIPPSAPATPTFLQPSALTTCPHPMPSGIFFCPLLLKSLYVSFRSCLQSLCHLLSAGGGGGGEGFTLHCTSQSVREYSLVALPELSL